MNRDSYRKALTSYGPHTADYMVTRLVRMAAAMHGGAELAPEPLDILADVDELRQQTESMVVGAASGSAYDAWNAGMPNDAGTPEAIAQPADITRFAAAQFAWRGGSTAADNPRVVVEHEAAVDQWLPFADQTGEVPVRVEFPDGVPGVLRTYVGLQEWIWTANFEAYSAFPARLGSTPPGRYRFCVEGRARQSFKFAPYSFCSDPFTVSAWNGLGVKNLVSDGSGVRFDTDLNYPRSYDGSAFGFIADNGSPRICDTCTFRPWASRGQFDHAELDIIRASGEGENLPASCDAQGSNCRVAVTLAGGDRATVRVFDRDGNTGSAVAR